MGIATYQDCQRCEPGYACPTTGMTEGTSVPCTAGYYCPSGTSSATEYACPAGRYSDATNLVSKEECTTTEAGYTSPAGSTSANKVACVAGHYCPAGTSYGNDIDCPAGTYSSTSNNDEVDDCAVCNEGYFCLGVAAPCQVTARKDIIVLQEQVLHILTHVQLVGTVPVLIWQLP